MSDKRILPEAQAYSDAIMEMRQYALLTKKYALEAESARVKLQRVLMSDGKTKIMAMDSGDIEAATFEIASVYGKARNLHKMANSLGRKLDVEMPSNPTYDDEYSDLYCEVVGVELSADARR
jgi:hypothetical protein